MHVPNSASVSYVADEKLLKDGLALDARYKSGESLSADELEQHSAYRNVLRQRATLVNSFDAKTGAFREQFQSGIGTARPNLWMPADCLKFLEEDLDSLLTGVEQIRSDFAKLPKEGLETLIGNTIVEDGLANYARGVVQPEYSAFPASNELAKWAGGWLAEEQRHERVLVELCLISDRVDSKQLENTSFTLLTHGFDGGYSADVVKLFVYTMVQELATFYSHKNVAAVSKENGGEVLPKILMKIAGDEFRHYMFYVSNFKEILTANPDLALVAYSQLMKDGFAMPATKMDRPDKEIYNDYVYTAQKSGVFSLSELAKCVRQVNDFLELDSVEPATEEGKAALQFLQDLPATYEKRAGKLESIEQRLERKNGPREIPTIWSQPSAEERKSQGA